MSTLNLLYNTNNPGIHYIVSAGQNINITELGTYNVVPIDLQALIGGSNKSMYSDNLFDKVNTPNMSNISGGGDVVCNEEMMNNNNISSNMSSNMNDNMSNMNRDNSDNNMNGNMSNMNRDNNDNNTLLTSSNNYNTYSDTYNNARQSNSMLDSCRGVKSDNRYTPSTPLGRNTLFTDNLSKLVFDINQGH